MFLISETIDAFIGDLFSLMVCETVNTSMLLKVILIHLVCRLCNPT